MKVLFVSSGKGGDVGYVVRNQGESLARQGIDIEYFTVTPGLAGYVKSIFRLKKNIRETKYDLIHAHYSLSAYVASTIRNIPIVVSLMGSDAFQNFILRWITRQLSHFRWTTVIVKTEEMKRRLKLNDAYVIPNGVDTERFIPVERDTARKRLGLIKEKKIVVFISVKNRPEKNPGLAMQAVESLNDSSVEFIHLHDTPNMEIPLYLNAADLLLLTSAREGGVNVIKEALACNCPIVSTDVGDVRQVTGGTEGCFISGADSVSIAENIKKALAMKGRTNGRERIFSLGIDSVSVAQRLCEIYEDAILKS
jgi:teichuronic acid biosynthesis glycosyltransferase TuaC